MKTNTWHELRYEGDKKFALRFKEGDRNFQSFSDQLQVILKLHNKFTKPKYGEDFMKEVRMFKLERLKPVDKSNRGRPSDDETCRSMSTDSGVSAGSGSSSSSSLQPGLPTGDNTSGESFAFRTLQHFGANRKPKAQNPPQKQPIAPRNAADSPRPIPRSVEDWQLPLERRDSTDEPYSDRASSIDEDPLYSPSENYSDSSTVEVTERRQMATSSGPSPGRQRPAANRPPPVPPRKDKDYVNIPNPALGKLKPNARSPPLPPPPPPNSKQPNDQRPKNVSLVRTRSGMPFPTTPSAAQDRQNESLQRQTSLQDPSSSSSVYGTAPSWRCVRCSLTNRALVARCAACEWTRTDAWECRGCSAVYSVDVVHCQACPAWRCRLCTFVNGGSKTETTVCGACLQK